MILPSALECTNITSVRTTGMLATNCRMMISAFWADSARPRMTIVRVPSLSLARLSSLKLMWVPVDFCIFNWKTRSCMFLRFLFFNIIFTYKHVYINKNILFVRKISQCHSLSLFLREQSITVPQYFISYSIYVTFHTLSVFRRHAWDYTHKNSKH